MCGTGGQLQGDVPWLGESVRIAERSLPIGVPATRAAERFGRRESTYSKKKKKRLRGFDSNEQSDDCVTIFDPVFTPGDTSYLRDHAGYVVLPVRLENEGWVIAVSFSDRCPTTADRAKRLPDGAVHSGVYAALRPVPVRDFPEGQLVSGEDQECVHRGQ